MTDRSEQIDRLIAERVTGWTQDICDATMNDITTSPAGNNIMQFHCRKCGNRAAFWMFPDEQVAWAHVTPLPPYSTDMNAAWEALKYACLGNPDHLADRPTLIVELFVLPQEQDVLNAFYALGVMSAWTPENICLAILKAYGVEILTPEQLEAREHGLNLVRRIEYLYETDEGFRCWLDKGMKQIERGEVVTFDEQGWHE